MWNDEDNNPYGSSFDQRDSPTSPSGNPQSPPARSSSYSYHAYQHSRQDSGNSNENRPTTPNSTGSSDEPPNFVSHPRDLSDNDEEPARKRGGYDSRVEQILYEHPELEIVIKDAGKNSESGGNYIVYTIQTGDVEVRRRYSDFSSLRNALVSLHPTLIIPPIPEKHTMADYAAKPTKAKEDAGIIDLRKRMLTVFLNRCRKMKEVREDGVWWRFLDPKTSWSEVLNSHPVSSIPKSVLKAPPLDTANPTQAHSYLPVPATSAKLRGSGSTSASGMLTSPTESSTLPSVAAHTIAGPQVFGRFPPTSRNLSEQDLDPYFVNFEASTRELEILLQGSIERVNRRTLSHLSTLATDMAELGARYNGFSLSEKSPTLAAAIERIGQAVDGSYYATEELSASLGASFAEPMRESAQFAGVVRNVLRYRVMKRIQEEMTKDELTKKKTSLETLERSEQEAKRIELYLSDAGSPTSPKRSNSSAQPKFPSRREGSVEDNASIDSDFPPTHDGAQSPPPSAPQGAPQETNSPTSPQAKRASGNFVTNKIFNRISHAVHGIVDVDPERTRRDNISKTKESLVHLEQALVVSEQDVKDASAGVLKDLKRFQQEKEEDLKRYMIAYAKCHIEWAKKNLETWEEARGEVNKIEPW
ncbi:MAG: Sorting nexin, cytoplasm-to-vacuole targeting pathway/endosomal sorting [Vezdaea aestivalis]|nr:MAG: Sorting nexin, cytoplasm-to-vacuole targeting pathway/endosomal sorting [Vezdaea aestivalis]